MPDDQKRSLMLMEQLARLRDAQLEGQRATLGAAARDAAQAQQRLTRLDTEIEDLDRRTRRLAQDAQAFHAHAVLTHARYRAARTELQASAREALQTSHERLQREQEAARRLLAERDALNARHDRLQTRVDCDVQRQESRELDGLVSARRGREKGRPC